MTKFVGVIIALLVMVSCDQPAFYNKYQAIEKVQWTKEKEYYFTFDIKDPTKAYDLDLFVRNSDRYPFQNLWLFMVQEPPIGPIHRDTIACDLADDYGNWYGKGISLHERKIALYEHYAFPDSGRYILSFRQGMRRDTLPGIHEIGLRITVVQ